MGFTDSLFQSAPEKYRGYYVRYDQLKQAIIELGSTDDLKKRTDSRDFLDSEPTQPVHRFQEMLQEELKKVNTFACVKHESLFLTLRRLCEQCADMSRGHASGRSSEDLTLIAQKIEHMGEEVVHLDSYVRMNYLGFKKLTERFDRVFGVSGTSWFVAHLHQEAFCNVRFDDILILLGLAWVRWRDAHDASAKQGDAVWKPPESFIRNTSKYWVKPEKVVLLKTKILKRMPYLIFGASEVDQERLLDPFALLDVDYAPAASNLSPMMAAYSGALEESQLLSSIYFDSEDAKCYQERILRREGARLVRFRWYGENHGEADKELYVERKVHHESWANDKSAKERCILPQRDIFSFMNGKFDINGFFRKMAEEGVSSEKARKKMKSIADEVNALIQERKMRPMIRTSYYRCAFQLATSNEVRISLDTQMTLLDECRYPHTEPWCLTGNNLLREDQIYRFPFAILEIKLQDVSETPMWLKEILSEIDAVQVHKFSKFQHAMAFLHPQRVPMLPHWHKDFEQWHVRKAAKVEEMKQPVSRGKFGFTSVEDETVPALAKAPMPGSKGHFVKDLDNLDPKSIFANERTLLHYLEKALYVGILAVALIRGSRQEFQFAGGMLAVLDAFFIIWALIEYQSRLGKITNRGSAAKNRNIRFDWAGGPMAAMGLVAFVMCLSAIGAVVK